MILIVTSKQQVADDLLELIGSTGYKTAAKDCADDVPRFVQFSKPQLVIVDCELKDSFQIIKEIRSDAYQQRVVLLMFAVAGDEWGDQALAAGADAFVKKGDLDWAELLEHIRRFIGPPPLRDRIEDI